MTEIHFQHVELDDAPLNLDQPWATLPLLDVVATHLVVSDRDNLEGAAVDITLKAYQFAANNFPWLVKASSLLREELGFHCPSCHVGLLEAVHERLCTSNLEEIKAGTFTMADADIHGLVLRLKETVGKDESTIH